MAYDLILKRRTSYDLARGSSAKLHVWDVIGLVALLGSALLHKTPRDPEPKYYHRPTLEIPFETMRQTVASVYPPQSVVSREPSYSGDSRTTVRIAPEQTRKRLREVYGPLTSVT